MSKSQTEETEKDFRSNAILILTLLGGLTFAGLAIILSSSHFFYRDLWINATSTFHYKIPSHYYFGALTTLMAGVSLVSVIGSVLLLLWGAEPSNEFYRDIGIFFFDLAVVIFAFLMPLFLLRLTLKGTVAVALVDFLFVAFIVRPKRFEKWYLSLKRRAEKKRPVTNE